MRQASGTPGESKRAFLSLDGVRGIAALFVVMFHYHDYILPLRVSSAYLAVDLFFLMSGFVIAYAYEDRLLERISPARFLTLRLIRLYPLYLIGLLVAVIVPVAGLLTGNSPGWSWPVLMAAAVPALLMLPGPYNGTGPGMLYPFNVSAWSLLFEVIINVVYALLIRARALLIERALLAIAAVLLIPATLLTGSLDGGWTWPGAWLALIRVTFSFFLGVAMFRLFVRGRLPQLRVSPLIPLFIVGIVLTMGPGEVWRPSYDLACVTLLFPAIIWLCVTNEPRVGGRVCSFLGLISYPIYVIHIPAKYMIDRVVDRIFHSSPEFHAPWIGLALLLVLVLLSWTLAVTYDVRARRLLTRLTSGRSTRKAPAAASTPLTAGAPLPLE